MNPEPLASLHVRHKRLVDLAPGKWLDVPLFWQQWGLAFESLDQLAPGEWRAGRFRPW